MYVEYFALIRRIPKNSSDFFLSRFHRSAIKSESSRRDISPSRSLGFFQAISRVSRRRVVSAGPEVLGKRHYILYSRFLLPFPPMLRSRFVLGVNKSSKSGNVCGESVTSETIARREKRKTFVSSWGKRAFLSNGGQLIRTYPHMGSLRQERESIFGKIRACERARYKNPMRWRPNVSQQLNQLT